MRKKRLGVFEVTQVIAPLLAGALWAVPAAAPAGEAQEPARPGPEQPAPAEPASPADDQTAPAPSLPQEAAAEPAPRPAMAEVAYVRTVESAIDTLPKRLRSFYKAHRAEMPSQALEPVFPERSPERRFLVDRLLPFPFRELPRSESALDAKFGERARGVGRLPWLIQESYARLVDAMKKGEKQRILSESDLLATLIVDVHMVVNLTENFDGQRTGQHGLHVRLTEKLPQAMRAFKLSPDAARYLDDPNAYVFSMMAATYVWLDNTLYLEDLARRGKAAYGDIYFEDLARRVGPIVRERLTSAAEDAGSYWYTAWTVAGRPELK